MSDVVTILRSGRIPLGNASVVLGAPYAAVFNSLPGFPETPEYAWREPRGDGARYVFTAPFLGYPPSRLSFHFVAGRLDMLHSEDPEGVADGWDGAASRKRAEELIAIWTQRLGPPAATWNYGEERSATWRFGDLALQCFYETKTPSVGFCARPAAGLPQLET